MSKKKLNKITYVGFGYRELQKENGVLRQKLKADIRAWLKVNNYRNIGWINVIALFDKLNEIVVDKLSDSSLEDLFSEVEQIGNKYQSSEEIQAFQTAMEIEAESMSEIIDRLFPDTEPESIDFGGSEIGKSGGHSSLRKTYRTIKV
jgi:hypothetical protein